MKSLVTFIIFLSFTFSELKNVISDVFETSISYVFDLEQDDNCEDEKEDKKKIEDDKFHQFTSYHLSLAHYSTPKTLFYEYPSCYNSIFGYIFTPPPEA